MLKLLRSLALGTLLVTLHGSILSSRSQSGVVIPERYQTVLDDFPQALAEAEQSGDVARQARVWYEYGEAQMFADDYERAKTSTETALRLARTLQLDPEQTTVQSLDYKYLKQLTYIYDRLGDPYGREFLEREVAQAQALGPERYHVAVRLLSEAYAATRSLSLLGRGIEVAQESLALARERGNTTEIDFALRILAGLQGLSPQTQSQGLNSEWERYDLILERGALSDQLGATLVLGATLQRAGDTAAALALATDRIEYHRTALAAQPWDLVNNESDRAHFEALNQIQSFKAYLHQSQRDYGQAIQTLESVVERTQKYEHPYSAFFYRYWAWRDMSVMQFWQGDLAQALAAQLQVQDQIAQEFPESHAFFQSGSDADQTGEHFGYASLSNQHHLLLGFLNLELGQLAAAEAYLNAAIQLDTYYLAATLQTPYVRTRSYRNTPDEWLHLYNIGSDAYELLQRISLQRGDRAGALVASENGRARGFLNLIKGRLQENFNPAALASNLTLQEIQAIARQENTTLVYYSLVYEAPHNWREGPWGFHERHVAQQLLVWVVTPDGQLTQRTVSLAEVDLKRLIRTLRRRVTSSTTSNRAVEPLQQMHSLLIAPIADQLPTDPMARVTFIPDDDLFFVPFPALQDAAGVELLDRHTILTAPSIQVLGEARQNKKRLKPQQKALVIGNPEMPEIPIVPGGRRGNLAPLPGAELEAKAIAQLFKTEPLLGVAATETHTKQTMQTAQYLHFATHGLLEQSGNANSLALTPSNQDDGFLTAREIVTLDLNAELAVLSACDTGNGEIANGEGVVGLSRAFLRAGAASLVVSLWAIPDQPTAVLMENFYTEFSAGTDQATALRQAMLKTREQFPAPGNWAAFTVMGAI